VPIKKLVPVLVVCCAVGSNVLAFAQSKTSGKATAMAAAPKSLRSGATTLRESGTIEKFDAATRMLSLSTPTGVQELTLGPSARIQESSKTIDASGLEKLAGHRATVRYSESSGNKVVESIRVNADKGKTKKS
jgi:hypothetical protein